MRSPCRWMKTTYFKFQAQEMGRKMGFFFFSWQMHLSCLTFPEFLQCLQANSTVWADISLGWESRSYQFWCNGMSSQTRMVRYVFVVLQDYYLFILTTCTYFQIFFLDGYSVSSYNFSLLFLFICLVCEI